MASLTRWLDRRRNPWKGVYHDAYRTWRRQKGQARLHQYGNLVPGDVVFDLGAARGGWTDTVLDQQPAAQMHLFEPHPGLADDLKRKFAGRDHVHVHELAIGANSGTIKLWDGGEASSPVRRHGKSVEVKSMSLGDFFTHTPVDLIALMKVDIESGEYDLLPALIETGEVSRIDRLQVQFHLFEPDMKAKRDDIRTRLNRTHHCVWSYPFVWEEWQLRP
ncbi:FkbM family methyltransferase [Roseovarius sp.]|uniref:FkbM family methyltransferase n=1 Tax=Roseovarius sp. TaxID=1486281 RepID=UPI003D0E9185